MGIVYSLFGRNFGNFFLFDKEMTPYPGILYELHGAYLASPSGWLMIPRLHRPGRPAFQLGGGAGVAGHRRCSGPRRPPGQVPPDGDPGGVLCPSHRPI